MQVSSVSTNVKSTTNKNCILKIGFAAAENVTSLKLIDAGVSKDNIMIMNTAMYLVKMIIPLVIAKTTSGPKPMCIYLKSILIR